MIKKNYIKIITILALLEAITILGTSLGYWKKIDNQQEIINKQNKKIEECSYEIKRLKLVEQNFEEEKEYLYECYKDIELKAERSGK
jgi:hypothetical protein